MGKGYDADLSAKINKLTAYVFKDRSVEDYEKSIEPELLGEGDDRLYAAFWAVCDTKQRARVFHAASRSLKEAIDEAGKKAAAGAKKYEIDPKWVKLEFTIHAEERDPHSAVEEMFTNRQNLHEWFRRGISFDKKYEYAYTEAEINGNRLLDYKNKLLDYRTFNRYSMDRDDDVLIKTPPSLIIFDTAGFFIDEKDKMYTLYESGTLDAGRRILEPITKDYIKHIVGMGMRYLVNQLQPDGSLIYGYYPIRHKVIPKYNILRHTSTLWSLVCSTAIDKNPDVYRATKACIAYMVSKVRHFENNISYLIEEKDHEIKLGGNSVAIITLSQYMMMYETDEYIPLCEKLGRGILKMMSPEGKFVHVLDSETREVKDAYRTVYYDGEATFALCRLYSLTKSKIWLEAARRSVDHFIAENYVKYRDHWVAYAVNELTMYLKDEKYYEFALRNLVENMDRIYMQETSYHTYLELLMAGFDTYTRIISEKAKVKYLEKLNPQKLADTIIRRAEHMLNGFGYPEYVMFMQNPGYFKGSFFVRHDGYRTRIDDVQHFTGAYIAFYRRFEEVMEMSSHRDLRRYSASWGE